MITAITFLRAFQFYQSLLLEGHSHKEAWPNIAYLENFLGFLLAQIKTSGSTFLIKFKGRKDITAEAIH